MVFFVVTQTNLINISSLLITNNYTSSSIDKYDRILIYKFTNTILRNEFIKHKYAILNTKTLLYVNCDEVHYINHLNW